MQTVRRLFWLIAVLSLSVVLLAACDGNDNNDNNLDNLNGNNEVGMNDDAFGNEVAETGDLDATADAAMDPTPLAPELTVTEALTTEVTPTDIPEATATAEPEIEATTAVTTTEETTDTAEAGTDLMGRSFLVRATTLFDLDLTGDVDEDDDELTDFLFDDEGKIHYAILERDADGEGEIVAVPWDSLDVEAIAADAASDYDYGISWVGDLDAVTASIESDAWTEDSIVVDADVLGLDLEMDATAMNLFRASAFVDEGLFDVAEGDVVDAEGTDVGEIEDMLVDVESGQVIYLLVDIGGFLGVGERNVAVPWEHMTFDATAEQLTVDIDVATLEEAPEFDVDDAFADGEIRIDDALRAELDAYWDVDVDDDGVG